MAVFGVGNTQRTNCKSHMWSATLCLSSVCVLSSDLEFSAKARPYQGEKNSRIDAGSDNVDPCVQC